MQNAPTLVSAAGVWKASHWRVTEAASTVVGTALAALTVPNQNALRAKMVSRRWEGWQKIAWQKYFEDNFCYF